jgi:hypothetical protein
MRANQRSRMSLRLNLLIPIIMMLCLETRTILATPVSATPKRPGTIVSPRLSPTWPSITEIISLYQKGLFAPARLARGSAPNFGPRK